MFGNFLFNIGYDTYCRRNGFEPSSQVEADYRAQCTKNAEASRIQEKARNEERAIHVASLPIVPMPFIKAGRLRENTLNGSVVHAVMSNSEDGGMDASWPREALCGDSPKILWTSAEGHAVTCPKCLKNLSSA